MLVCRFFPGQEVLFVRILQWLKLAVPSTQGALAPSHPIPASPSCCALVYSGRTGSFVGNMVVIAAVIVIHRNRPVFLSDKLTSKDFQAEIQKWVTGGRITEGEPL